MMRGLRSIFQALWVFFMFIGCTVVFYYGILWVSEEYKNYHRYDEPKGRAVKVHHQQMDEDSLHSWERLRIFLNHGE
ncbi:YqzK family protein [Bacillus shivajii]|uniref:YqzK family protein n=1 Tax=Bacillus shivajii TaxID=1983719 RepID=UPI001CFB8EB8|nr:YqzK family protein [Bacillus shivajii]UCZ54690.1 YqzK family protein [Bacillus shivajii]